MPSVLCFVAHYLPGSKAGGALRSVANLVEAMDSACTFRIVTSDRDLGDEAPYPDVRRDLWQTVGRAQVRYVGGAIGEVTKPIRDTPADVVYLNSFFDYRFSIVPLLATRRHFGRARRIVLAPRGEFSPGALALKRSKKQIYLALARRSGLYRGIVWHASTPLEATDIRRQLGDLAADIRIAPDLVGPPEALRADQLPGDRSPLRICFVSRISPKKNLAFALEVLRAVTARVEFDVYGPAEDPTYLAHCRKLAEALPSHVRVCFHDALDHSEVVHILGRSHLFFLPTRGENFGHVIAEALGAGTPVLISDQTPWRDLAASGAGWDLPLERPEAYARAIESVSRMSEDDYLRMRGRAHEQALSARPQLSPAALASLFFDQNPTLPLSSPADSH